MNRRDVADALARTTVTWSQLHAEADAEIAALRAEVEQLRVALEQRVVALQKADAALADARGQAAYLSAEMAEWRIAALYGRAPEGTPKDAIRLAQIQEAGRAELLGRLREEEERRAEYQEAHGLLVAIVRDGDTRRSSPEASTVRVDVARETWDRALVTVAVVPRERAPIRLGCRDPHGCPED